MVLDGKKLARQIREQVKKNIEKDKLKPGLAAILIGKDPGSLVYLSLKRKAAKKIGIHFREITLSGKSSQKKVLNLIDKLNKNKTIHGIIVQFPLPRHLKPNPIIKAILPAKDVDGFNPESKFIPPTHQAILKLLKATNKNLKNKKTLILSENPVFADLLAKILQKRGLRCPAKDPRQADVLIVALGKPKIIKPKMVKENSVVIDVGYTRIRGKPAGDVSPEVQKKVAYLSPVPGGVGPLTVAYLLRNTYLACKKTRLQTNKK